MKPYRLQERRLGTPWRGQWCNWTPVPRRSYWTRERALQTFAELDTNTAHEGLRLVGPEGIVAAASQGAQHPDGIRMLAVKRRAAERDRDTARVLAGLEAERRERIEGKG